MYTISKEFHFSAKHQLIQLPPEHKCARDHGHNYVVIVELRARDLDANGFVLDYGALDAFGGWINANVDHRSLNEIRRPIKWPEDDRDLEAARQTTAENLAAWFHDILEHDFGIAVAAVTVCETPKTRAEYRPVRSLSSNLPPSHWPHRDPNAQ